MGDVIHCSACAAALELEHVRDDRDDQEVVRAKASDMAFVCEVDTCPCRTLNPWAGEIVALRRRVETAVAAKDKAQEEWARLNKENKGLTADVIALFEAARILAHPPVSDEVREKAVAVVYNVARGPALLAEIEGLRVDLRMAQGAALDAHLSQDAAWLGAGLLAGHVLRALSFLRHAPQIPDVTEAIAALESGPNPRGAVAHAAVERLRAFDECSRATYMETEPTDFAGAMRTLALWRGGARLANKACMAAEAELKRLRATMEHLTGALSREAPSLSGQAYETVLHEVRLGHAALDVANSLGDDLTGGREPRVSDLTHIRLRHYLRARDAGPKAG